MLLAICLFFSLSTEAQTLVESKILFGRTIGRQPYLDYGLGSDRLGGAKMTYLDTGILVQAVDSTIGRYKIQLSKNRTAWLQKANFQKVNSIKIEPYYLTSSFLINGDDKYDLVSINLDEKLPYTSIQQINPSRIVVDIFGATSNTNWVTHRTSAKEIKNVYHEQVEDDVFRVIIELKHKQHWGYSIYYEGKKLFIKVKRQPEDLSFLGIGVQPPQPSWGLMIKENYNFIITQNPMLALAPGFAIMLLVLAFNLLGNGLRDALNVRGRI